MSSHDDDVRRDLDLLHRAATEIDRGGRTRFPRNAQARQSYARLLLRWAEDLQADDLDGDTRRAAVLVATNVLGPDGEAPDPRGQP